MKSLSELVCKKAEFDAGQAKDDAQIRIELMKPVHAAILQVEAARFENGRLLPLIQRLAEELEVIEFKAHGCSDGNCVLRDRDGGQHTNGGCRCKRNMRVALTRLAQLRKSLEET